MILTGRIVKRFYHYAVQCRKPEANIVGAVSHDRTQRSHGLSLTIIKTPPSNSHADQP